MKIVCIALCAALTLCHATGQSVQLQGFTITFPEGHVIGAAFHGDIIFIQQSVLRAAGSNLLSSRRVVSWNVKTNLLLKERTLDGTQSVPGAEKCGRIEVDTQIHGVVICEDPETLAVLNEDSLKSTWKIHCGGRILDFAIDETGQRVFVAWQSELADQYLTAFNVVTGRRDQQVKISSGVLATAQISIDPRVARAAIAESRYGRTGYTTSLISCNYAESMSCERVATLKQTAQIAILGQEVLLASGLLADDPHVCLTSVNLATKEVGHKYCAPQTGVHYGVGVLEGRYVVGYSGVEKRLTWREVTVNLSSSVSLWRYENEGVVARASQEMAPQAFPTGARIACSRGAPQFLLYSLTSNVGYVYVIAESGIPGAPPLIGR